MADASTVPVAYAKIRLYAPAGTNWEDVIDVLSHAMESADLDYTAVFGEITDEGRAAIAADPDDARVTGRGGDS